MYIRILSAPPGYDALGQRYMVVAYTTMEYVSNVKDSTTWASSLEQARSLLPPGAVRLDFEPSDQFLELWEVSEFSNFSESK